MVAGNENVIVSPGSTSFIEVVAVHVDLLVRVGAHAEAHGVALLEPELGHLAAASRAAAPAWASRSAWASGSPSRRARRSRWPSRSASASRSPARRSSASCSSLPVEQQDDHGDDRDDDGDAEEREALGAGHGQRI